MIEVRETLAALRRDAAQRAQLTQTVVWLGPVFWIAIWLVARVLRDHGRIDPGQYTWMLRIGVLAAVILALLSAWVFRKVAEALVHTMTAGGAAPSAPAFSLEESMLVRGEHRQAQATLEARLNGGPDDPAVQLRLAELHAWMLREPTEAEHWYLAARKGAVDEHQRVAVANGLIDLYRATGQRGRLMVELARFAQSWPTSRAAADARRELHDLKREPA